MNLCGHDYIPSQQISSSTRKPILNQDTLKVSIEENKDIIESRYKDQNKLMDAMAKGDKAEVNNIIDSMSGIIRVF